MPGLPAAPAPYARDPTARSPFVHHGSSALRAPGHSLALPLQCEIDFAARIEPSKADTQNTIGKRKREMMHDDTISRCPAALFIGHPGHELRVFGWIRAMRPKVCILTDGSGTTGASRLERSRKLLWQLGAESGCVFGRFSDREIYQAMMAGEVARFASLVDEIAEEWIRDGVEVVACDAREGYSATHDLCCEMAQAAIELVRAQTGRQIQRFMFCLTEWEGGAPQQQPKDAHTIGLNEEILAEKIAAAMSYVELRSEVERALTQKGADYFRAEYLLPASGWTTEDETHKPTYEIYGETRVAEGKYASVLRYGRHVLPVFKGLREHVGSANRLGAASAGMV